MSANIVHGTNHAVFTTHDDECVFPDFKQLVVADAGNFAGMERIDPTFKDQMLELELVHEMRTIKVGIHCTLGLGTVRCQLGAQFVDRIVNVSRYQMH